MTEVPDPFPALDRQLKQLRDRKQAWRDLPLARKISYASALLRGFHRVARGQVEAAVQAKGGRPDSAIAAEEWLAGPYINIRTTRLLIESLRQLRDLGRVDLPPRTVRSLPDGRLAIRVFPLSAFDRMLYAGFHAEVRLAEGVDRSNLDRHVGRVYREQGAGRVALVLGAGNVSSIGPLDAVHKLFSEGQVVLLKLNPVNDYLQPFVEDAFAELIADGFVRVTSGGAEVGEYLCRHPEVDEIHITGSARTHDLIVFGPGEEGAERKRRNQPLLRKPITSELGNVSPMILVPGRWSAADLDFQAENVATQMTQNAGFNCNATKVIVTHAEWPQRADFLERLGVALSQVRRQAYYPGAAERFDRFVGAYPQARLYGERSEGRLPVALVPGLDPGDDGPAYGDESFCTFSVETRLAAAGPGEFLERAVEFCNQRLYGSLNAGITLSPASRSEVSLDRAVDRLRYGSVAINHWPALSYGLGSTPWGAYPGHTLDDVQSGIGTVHNALLLEKIEKAVVRGPFRVFPKPVWFTSHRSAHRVAPHLVELEATQNPLRLAPIFFHALRG